MVSMDDSCPNPENVDSEETMDVNNNDHMEEDAHDGDTVGYSPLDTEDTTTTTLEYSYQPISYSLGPNNDDDDDDDDTHESINYQALANQALRSLDMEYNAVINAGRTHSSTAETSLPISSTNTTSTLVEEDSTRRIQDGLSSETVIESHDDNQEEEALANDKLEDESSEEKQENGTVEEEERILPSIDSDAVLRAVRAIRLQSPQLTQSLDNNSSSILLPSSHSIIPSKPLSAFQRNSTKAILATANLTRSATLAEAYSRLFLLTQTNSNQHPSSSSSLLIHILGADHVECQAIHSTFAPFVRWIGASSYCSTIEHVRIELLGPNVPISSQNMNDPINIMPRHTTATTTTTNSPTNLKSATVVCQNCCYHDYLKEKQQSSNSDNNDKSDDDSYYPDLIIVYNAGIWGYDKWKPTLEAMCLVFEKKEVPTIITAYTVEEAEDDTEVIEEVIKSSCSLDNTFEKAMLKQKCLWPAQTNPFRSKKKRDTASAPKNRIYYENGAWQAWLFGKQQQDS